MTMDEAQGTVTIYRSGRTGMYADDYGVTVRNGASRTLRFAWAEIGCFADGARYSEGSYFWVMHIVLHSGRKVMASVPNNPETLAAIRQVADRYGVPADLAGVPVKNGRPVRRDLYEDPGGQAGLRYWDGKQWSPLLPPDIGKPGTIKKSLGSWSALPTAEGRWTGAKTEAVRTAMIFALMAAVSAALLAWTLLNEVGFYHVGQRDHWGVGMWLVLYVTAALMANIARGNWRHRKLLVKLDEAANRSAGRSVH